MDSVDSLHVRSHYMQARLELTRGVLSVTGIYFLALVIGMRETRASVLLMRIARNLRKETGDFRYRARVEDERGSLRSLIMVSCTRPLRKCSSVW